MLEPFEDRIQYKQNKIDISKCSDYTCLKHTENTCNVWCLENVKNEKISGICRKKCKQITKEMIESMMWQYATFGGSMYKFSKFGGNRLYLE
jgi:hypothetical protein